MQRAHVLVARNDLVFVVGAHSDIGRVVVMQREFPDAMLQASIGSEHAGGVVAIVSRRIHSVCMRMVPHEVALGRILAICMEFGTKRLVVVGVHLVLGPAISGAATCAALVPCSRCLGTESALSGVTSTQSPMGGSVSPWGGRVRLRPRC